MTEERSSADGVCWDLSDLYASIDDPKLESDLQLAEERAKAYEVKYRSIIKPGISAMGLQNAVKELEDLHLLVDKPMIYAHLVFTEECTKPEYGALLQKVREKHTEINKHLVFFELAWCAIDENEANTLINSPELVNYKHFLGVLRLMKPHQLSEPEEKLWQALSNTGRLAFIRLFDETMGRLTVEMEIDGKMKSLQLDAALTMLRDPSRETRIKAHKAITEALEKNMPVLIYIFNTLVQDHYVHDQFRKFSHPMASRNLSNQVDDETINSLLAATDNNIGMVARYYRLKKKILNIGDLYDYDRYAPILSMKKECRYDEAKQMVLNSYNSFSPRAAEIAKMFFDNNWIHAELRPGKEGGAFAASVTSDLHPYILLNYTDDLDDVMTMAHELGHGIHQYLSREQGYFQMSTSLAMAETASVFGEMVLFNRLLAGEQDPKMKLSLLCNKIEDMFATCFRQTMMTRFEKRLHETRRTEGEVSVENLHKMWKEENEWMFGDSVIITDEYSKWWSYVFHFVHYSFYTYAYAFGELMVLSLYEEYKSSGDEFVGKYMDLLTAGGADYPRNLVAKIGLDITDPTFWQKGLDLMNGMIDQAEELAKELGYQ